MWFQQVRARIERDGPPPVTFAAFLGDAFPQMAANQVANLAERRIRTVMYTCARPVTDACECRVAHCPVLPLTRPR